MNPILWFGFQFSVMTLVATGAWVSAKRYYGPSVFTPRLDRAFKRAILAGMAVNVFTFLLHMGFGPAASIRYKPYWVLKFAIYGWHFLLFFVWVGVLVMSVVRPTVSRVLPTNLARRAFLRISAAAPVAAPIISLPAGAWGATKLKVRHVDLFYPRLPPSLEGLTLGQVSDMHLGPFLGVEHLKLAVDAVASFKPDLFFMTGDLADTWQLFEPAARVLDTVESARGRSFACIGNHEYYAGRWAFTKAFRHGEAATSGRMKLLLDEHETVEVRGGAARIRVVGVDFPMYKSGKPEAPVDATLFSRHAVIAPEDFTICLAHHPRLFTQTAELGADLTLSGHIHAYQMRFAGISVGHVFSTYVDGVYRGPTPETSDRQLFVTAGTGHWLPLRFNCPAEVVLIRLSRGDPRESRWKLEELPVAAAQ